MAALTGKLGRPKGLGFSDRLPQVSEALEKSARTAATTLKWLAAGDITREVMQVCSVSRPTAIKIMAALNIDFDIEPGKLMAFKTLRDPGGVALASLDLQQMRVLGESKLLGFAATLAITPSRNWWILFHKKISDAKLRNSVLGLLKLKRKSKISLAKNDRLRQILGPTTSLQLEDSVFVGTRRI